MKTTLFIILLFLCQFGAAQYDKYYLPKDKTLDERFSEYIKDVLVSGVLHCVVEVKKGKIVYTYYGKKELLTNEVLRFFEAIKADWNRKAIGKEKLLLPIYMMKSVNGNGVKVDIDEAMKTSVPPAKYTLLKYLGVYNSIIDD